VTARHHAGSSAGDAHRLGFAEQRSRHVLVTIIDHCSETVAESPLWVPITTT